MTAPTLPLDALVGYTVTRVGHVFTLPPATKGPAMTQDHALVCPADPHERKAIVRMARDPEWHLDHTSGWCLLHDADHAEHWVRDVTDDYFAMGVRTMTEQQAAAEAAHTADQDLYHDRAEWRAQ